MKRPKHADVMREYSPEQAFQLLRLSQAEISQTIGEVPDGPDIWSRRTEAFRDLIKQRRKDLLREFHPDVCKDPDALQKSQEINRVADMLLATQILPPPRPVRRPVMQSFHFGNDFTSTGTTTTRTTTSGIQVTIIKTS